MRSKCFNHHFSLVLLCLQWLERLINKLDSLFMFFEILLKIIQLLPLLLLEVLNKFQLLLDLLQPSKTVLLFNTQLCHGLLDSLNLDLSCIKLVWVVLLLLFQDPAPDLQQPEVVDVFVNFNSIIDLRHSATTHHNLSRSDQRWLVPREGIILKHLVLFGFKSFDYFLFLFICW